MSGQEIFEHVFRSLEQAREFTSCIRLGEGQSLVGGTTNDSVGRLWWLACASTTSNAGAMCRH
ncbi:MAG: hypothetical protein P8011_11575 [Acidihalobacter sp.]|jgi:hypothetical protein